MAMKPLRIMLADLTHINEVNQHNMYVPLNVGYVAAYVKQRFGAEVEVSLFKDPAKLLAAAREKPPEILGLGAYYWKNALNEHVAMKVKEISRATAVVVGGPCIDSAADVQDRYMLLHPNYDAVIPNEGEVAFGNFVERALGVWGSRRIETGPIPGVIARTPGGDIVRGAFINLATDLEGIPSPYLDGFMDDWLDGSLQPLLQTARLCPYTCLAGDTPVNTILGDIPIRELAKRGTVPVYTYDPETRRVFISDSVEARKYGSDQQLVRVSFDDGTHIDCTPDHRFLQFERGGRQWECEAAQLPAGAGVRAMRVEVNQHLQRAYVTWGRRGRQLRSRMVKEHEVGRRLARTEHVHHTDHDTLNDAPDNLVLCASAADHSARHPEIAERMRVNNPTKGGLSQEWRDRLSVAGRGKTRSLESRLRYRESKLGARNPNFKDGATSGRGSRIAEVNHRVTSVEWLAAKGDVYCLTVPATGWFFANNVLVKNCAFCVSGKDRGKMRAFSRERVREEVEYVARKFGGPRDTLFYIVDENFGIMERDIGIADDLLRVSNDRGYPNRVYFYNDKRFTHIARAVHERVGHMVWHGVCLSLQSENPDALKAMQRRNLTDQQLADALAWAKGLGFKTSTELIFGVPGETLASFCATVDKCARLGFDVVNSYNLITFDGVEMDRQRYRKEYGIETRLRPIHGSASVVDGELVVEQEEVVVASKTFSIADFLEIRRINVLLKAIYALGVEREFFTALIASGRSLSAFLLRFGRAAPEDADDEVSMAHRAFCKRLTETVRSNLFDERGWQERTAALKAGPHLIHLATNAFLPPDAYAGGWLNAALSRTLAALAAEEQNDDDSHDRREGTEGALQPGAGGRGVGAQ